MESEVLSLRRGPAALVLFSLVVWVVWTLLRPAHPFGDLSNGQLTDHFSDMNTARVFPDVGLDIWRKPLGEVGQALTPEEIAALPQDVRVAASLARTLPGWPPVKPFVSSWLDNPSFHPIGNMVLTAPVAAAYHFTDLSFAWANRLLILLFLVYAHVSLYVLTDKGSSSSALRPVTLFILLIVWSEAIHWSLEGFYEAAAIGPLLISARFLHMGRNLPAVFAFSAAANIHFRTYFLAPLALIAACRIIRKREWRQWKRPQWLLLTGIGILSALSLGAFGLLWPALTQIRVTNPLNATIDNPDAGALAAFVAVGALVAYLFVRAQAWTELAILLWFVVMLLFLREALYWDVLSMLAWLGSPIRARDGWQGYVRDGRLFFFFFMSVLVFGNSLVPVWLRQVVGIT